MDNGVFDLLRAAHEGDASAMEKMVSDNERLVWSIVKRFAGRGYEPEDLFQLGCIGLVKAVKNFDFSKNVKFSTYAVPLILGEIRKFLRDDGTVKVSRSLKELAAKAKYAADRLREEKGTEPGIAETAAALGVPEESITEALAASAAPISLYQPLNENSDITVIDTINAEDEYEKIIDKMALKNAAGRLPVRERNIIYMRYYQNRTQSEIAKLMGISQVQVSRLEKKIIDKLRKEIV